jgi:DNA-binding CsgD family transcriptional regulator
MKLIQNISKGKNTSATESFNDREIEIIKMLCEQKSSKEIADKICLSIRTVEGYRMKIMKKINAINHSGIVLYAVKAGLIPQNEL